MNGNSHNFIHLNRKAKLKSSAPKKENSYIYLASCCLKPVNVSPQLSLGSPKVFFSI